MGIWDGLGVGRVLDGEGFLGGEGFLVGALGFVAGKTTSIGTGGLDSGFSAASGRGDSVGVGNRVSSSRSMGGAAAFFGLFVSCS